jgi:hypothetical protein
MDGGILLHSHLIACGRHDRNRRRAAVIVLVAANAVAPAPILLQTIHGSVRACASVRIPSCWLAAHRRVHHRSKRHDQTRL